MKKVLSVFALAFLCLLSVGCSKKRELNVLNVGDYINEELVAKFEKKYNCRVNYTEKGSNEEIYQTILYDNYDVLVVSDYMIDRLAQENRIEQLDFTKFNEYEFDDLFVDAQSLINSQCTSFKNYFVPYFWGTVGILYNTSVQGLESYVKTNGLKSVFMPSDKYKIGMYNSARDALCLAAIANGETDINTSNESVLEAARDTLIRSNYTVWGEDTLKGQVHSGQIDLALVYSGDYLDQVYACDINNEEVNFAYYAPEVTNIWIDGMVITKDAPNMDLAYSFIDFFAEEDNAAENSDYIGYCPIYKDVFDDLYEDYGYTYSKEEFYPYSSKRLMYRYVGEAQYLLLNELLEQAKSNNK
ncbi:MAG: extracellular solute-binding protein [Gammaproteobacteria bacterium]|nr:extracellular solute-binding protein [Gammaproteobacteria bacterium]